MALPAGGQLLGPVPGAHGHKLRGALRTCAEAVLKRYSIAFFEAAKRRKQGLRAGFPRRKRGLVPVRFRFGCFAVDGSRVRLGVARGAPELWVRLGREIPYPSESIRSLTLVAEAGRLYLD